MLGRFIMACIGLPIYIDDVLRTRDILIQPFIAHRHSQTLSEYTTPSITYN